MGGPKIALPKLVSFLAGLFVLIAMIAGVIWFFVPLYRGTMYRPGPEHRKAAIELLQGVIGDDAKRATVPAVNNDIGLIYVISPLAPASV